MAETIARITLLTGEDYQWEARNPVLLKGEVGFRNVEGNSPLMKVGDGLRHWADLPDINTEGTAGQPGPTGPPGPQGVPGPEGPRGPAGDASEPTQTPFSITDYSEGTAVGVMKLGFNQGPDPNIPWTEVRETFRSGHCGPYAWWINTEGDYANILQIHHYWPMLHLQGLADGRGSIFEGNIRTSYFSIDGLGPVLEIKPDGSGRIGAPNWPNSTYMYWYPDDRVLGKTGFEIIGSEAGGKWGLPGGGTLNVWGLVSCHFRNAFPLNYSFYISNDSPYVGANVASCNGLRIGAGWDRSDKPLRIVNLSDQTLFEIRGDGAIVANPARATSGQFAVWYNGDQIVVQSSSARYKTNIRSTRRDRAREIVSKLRLVNFNSLCPDDDPSQMNYGLIAEEVAAIEPSLAGYDKQGRPEGVNYQSVTLLLLPLVQELLGMTEPTGESYG